ncbi:peptidoglycan recognition protein [Streptomyces sp. NPDC047022]|uniref:peptidoglycan recognition protein family protein n=1 Tax=Streptomyces sp. NPDC047022 TaxID=3155737 RepID=UPI0033E984A2
MRGYLASSFGLACATVLTLTSALPSAAAGPDPMRTRNVPAAESFAGAQIPGSTQSLPLQPLGPHRAGAAVERGLEATAVRSFSLAGVVWDDPGVELHGRVQIRTRSSRTGVWSAWQELETHNRGHGPDPATMEGRSSRMRGSTAPLWVGDSDGVEVRVRAEAVQTGETRAPVLPDGLRVELVDPGVDPRSDALGQAGQGVSAAASASRWSGGAYGSESSAELAASAVNANLAPLNATVIPALSREATRKTANRWAVAEPRKGGPGAAGPFIGPRPRIVTRAGWGADESLREPGFVYTGSVKVAFVHHTVTGNNYSCSQAPSIIRGIYRYHVVSSGWRDIGYNFLIDKCGTIYEGRAGGVDKPVMGAHTLGFNTNSTGIAVLGTFTNAAPSTAAMNAIASLTAWKLGLSGMDPRAKTYLQSGGGNLYPKGQNALLNVISGHRDGFATECPGEMLYGRLGTARSAAARLQGR